MNVDSPLNLLLNYFGKQEMGQSHISFEKNNFFNSFRFTAEVNDPQFGVLYKFENNVSGEPCFLQELDLDIVREKNVPKIRERYRFSHPNILDIFNVFEVSGAHLNRYLETEEFKPEEILKCIVFDYFHSDLEHRIHRMKAEGRKFSESQLWRLAHNLCSALSTMQEKGIPHGRILPSRILIDPQNTYKLSVIQPIISGLTVRDFKLNDYKKDVYDMG